MKLLLTILALIYAVFPRDLLPDYLPGWGQIDDLVVFYLLWKFYYSPASRRRKGLSTGGEKTGFRRKQGARRLRRRILTVFSASNRMPPQSRSDRPIGPWQPGTTRTRSPISAKNSGLLPRNDSKKSRRHTKRSKLDLQPPEEMAMLRRFFFQETGPAQISTV